MVYTVCGYCALLSALLEIYCHPTAAGSTAATTATTVDASVLLLGTIAVGLLLLACAVDHDVLLLPVVLVLLRLLLGVSVLDPIMALDGILGPGPIQGDTAIACSVSASAVESYATQFGQIQTQMRNL